MHSCPVGEGRFGLAVCHCESTVSIPKQYPPPNKGLWGQGVHSMRVMQIGLGPIGCAVCRLLVQKSGWHIVAAVDADPAKQGRDLGDIVGLEQRLGVTVASDLTALQGSDIDLAFLTTVSTLPEVLPTLSTLIQHAIDVVSSTEELFYP